MGKQTTKPRILLTNDDGVNAGGLRALFDSLSDLGDCTIVAPLVQCSAVSHGITLNNPIRVHEVSFGSDAHAWAVSGTPADCVKFALQKVLPEKPDLIVSGINNGSNTAIDAMYSGTVAGAAEGGLLNIPSFAISVTSYGYDDYTAASEFARTMAEKLLECGLPDYTFLNVNVPPEPKEQIAGVKITRQGLTRYREIFDHHVDSSNNEYYWLRGDKVLIEAGDDSDEGAVSKKYIAITPLQYDRTNYKALDYLRSWKLPWNNSP